MTKAQLIAFINDRYENDDDLIAAVTSKNDVAETFEDDEEAVEHHWAAFAAEFMADEENQYQFTRSAATSLKEM